MASAFMGVLNEGCSGLWQIVRKPDAELSRQPYRDAEDVSYPSKQDRFESYQWITKRFIERLNRGLASLRSPFELRIARAQAVLSATIEIVRLVSEDNMAHPNLSPTGLLLDISRFLPNR